MATLGAQIGLFSSNRMNVPIGSQALLSYFSFFRLRATEDYCLLLCGVVSRVRAGVCCVCGLTSRCVQHVVLHVAFLHACVFSVASYGVCVRLCVSFED